MDMFLCIFMYIFPFIYAYVDPGSHQQAQSFLIFLLSRCNWALLENKWQCKLLLIMHDLGSGTFTLQMLRQQTFCGRTFFHTCQSIGKWQLQIVSIFFSVLCIGGGSALSPYSQFTVGCVLDDWTLSISLISLDSVLLTAFCWMDVKHFRWYFKKHPATFPFVKWQQGLVCRIITHV